MLFSVYETLELSIRPGSDRSSRRPAFSSRGFVVEGTSLGDRRFAERFADKGRRGSPRRFALSLFESVHGGSTRHLFLFLAFDVERQRRRYLRQPASHLTAHDLRN